MRKDIGGALSRTVTDDINALQEALKPVQAAYARHQDLFDRAVSTDVKNANIAACARWNQVDRAIRRAITRLNALRT